MYKKKNNKPLLLTIGIVILVIAAIIAMRFWQADRENVPETEAPETEAESETPTHNVLLYKTGAGIIEFDSQWLKSDTESESVLEIREDTLVTLLVTPHAGKILESVDILDYDFNEISSFISEPDADTQGDAKRINFVMPDRDIIVNFKFQQLESETAAEAEYETEAGYETEVETEPMAETESPYGLTLHGVTADIITEYNGMFDDRVFLQQLGDALHMDSTRSEYRRVTDVTFSAEDYSGERDDDKIYHYVYFNEEPEWKVLATYYVKEDSYLFTEVEPETEPESETQAVTNGNASGSSGTNYQASGTQQGGAASQPSGGQTITTTTSFDILSVSETFLSYVGGQETFYQKAFDYVLGKNLTGEIVGTMSSYEIDPEEQKATIKITLNIGGSIVGTYDKKKNSFSFTGL